MDNRLLTIVIMSLAGVFVIAAIFLIRPLLAKAADTKKALKLKKPVRIIIIAAIALIVVLSVVFSINRIFGTPLIEMKITYEENPAFWFKDMKLIWGDAVYYEIPMGNPNKGRQIGYATNEYSTWRIYELSGYNHDYLLAVESKDVWRVMSIHTPEKPFKQYILENATEKERFERMLSVTLYEDGTAQLAIPPISSYFLPSCTYAFTDGELLICARIETEKAEDAFSLKNGEVIARFEVVDDNTLVFRSSTKPLFADEGARYTSVLE